MTKVQAELDETKIILVECFPESLLVILTTSDCLHVDRKVWLNTAHIFLFP